MDSADSGAWRRDVEEYIAYSSDCIRRSLELIQQSDRTKRECADLLIMFQYALEDEAVVRTRFKRSSEEIYEFSGVHNLPVGSKLGTRVSAYVSSPTVYNKGS